MTLCVQKHKLCDFWRLIEGQAGMVTRSVAMRVPTQSVGTRKNWSFLYRDQVTPRLSPAYDIVTTSVYIDGEKKYALNLGKTKEWHKVSLEHFAAWADRSGIPWRAIKPHLTDTMEKARDVWPARLKELPMDDDHKKRLRTHWQNLQPDFRIVTE